MGRQLALWREPTPDGRALAHAQQLRSEGAGLWAALREYAAAGGRMDDTRAVADAFGCGLESVRMVRRELVAEGAMPPTRAMLVVRRSVVRRLPPNPGWREERSPPATRAECEDLARPCDRTRCRHWLPAGEHGCALDHAERGEMEAGDVAAVMMVTHERAEQLERTALAKLRALLEDDHG